MPSPILLIGGGGHCASCIEVILSTSAYTIHGVIDSLNKIGEAVLGASIIGSDKDLVEIKKECGLALVTVGFIKTPEIRKRIYGTLLELGYELPIIVASTAYKAVSSTILNGTILMHQSMVNARARVGKNCIINTKALVEHDALIGDNCHVSTGAIVNGNCIIGEDCFLGSGSVVRNGTTIIAGCVVGAGAVVVSNIDVPGIYVGNPARKI